jgi:hypothetical protein
MKTIVDQLSPEIIRLSIGVGLEISNWFSSEIELTPLENWRFSGGLLD